MFDALTYVLGYLLTYLPSQIILGAWFGHYAYRVARYIHRRHRKETKPCTESSEFSSVSPRHYSAPAPTLERRRNRSRSTT